MHRVAVILGAGVAWAGSAAGQCTPGWSPLGSGTNYIVASLTVFDDSAGPALYAGGWFTSAGGTSADCVAEWDGSTWSPLGSGIGRSGGAARVNALAVFDDGAGPALYAGGVFTSAGGTSADNTAKWSGSAWFPLGSGLNGWVNALTVFDDGTGPALYAGGFFTSAGSTSASRIARWDGESWSSVGAGVSGYVLALAVFDDGAGPALYAGGLFASAGGTRADNIAKWNGMVWSPLGSGTNDYVLALTVFDDGTGAALYAGGSFTSAGGTSADRIAKWNGSIWSPLGQGMAGDVPRVLALTVFDDSAGPALYAGGRFTSAGGTSADCVAKWDGSTWSPLGSGMDQSGGAAVNALNVFDDGAGSALYAGGDFVLAGGASASYIARWGCAEPVCRPDCNDDGKLNVNDFICFQTEWRERTAYGDYNGDGEYDVNDFIAFQAAWRKGC